MPQPPPMFSPMFTASSHVTYSLLSTPLCCGGNPDTTVCSQLARASQLARYLPKFIIKIYSFHSQLLRNFQFQLEQAVVAYSQQIIPRYLPTWLWIATQLPSQLSSVVQLWLSYLGSQGSQHVCSQASTYSLMFQIKRKRQLATQLLGTQVTNEMTFSINKYLATYQISDHFTCKMLH